MHFPFCGSENHLLVTGKTCAQHKQQVLYRPPPTGTWLASGGPGPSPRGPSLAGGSGIAGGCGVAGGCGITGECRVAGDGAPRCCCPRLPCSGSSALGTQMPARENNWE